MRKKIAMLAMMTSAFMLTACQHESSTKDLTMVDAKTSIKKGLVIRGGSCSKSAFEAGAEHVSGNNISGLSVNCTTATNDKNDFDDYLDGIDQYSSFCVAKWPNLDTANITVVTDKVKGNRYHCLLSGNVNTAVSKFTAMKKP